MKNPISKIWKTISPKARREQAEELELAKEKAAYEAECEFCFRTNVNIMETILKQCPDNHLIVIERTVGWPGESFEESKANLLYNMKELDAFRYERGSCRLCYNPRLCWNNPEWMVRKYWSSGYQDIIIRWEYVPYPKDWQK